MCNSIPTSAAKFFYPVCIYFLPYFSFFFSFFFYFEPSFIAFHLFFILVIISFSVLVGFSISIPNLTVILLDVSFQSLFRWLILFPCVLSVLFFPNFSTFSFCLHMSFCISFSFLFNPYFWPYWFFIFTSFFRKCSLVFLFFSFIIYLALLFYLFYPYFFSIGLCMTLYKSPSRSIFSTSLYFVLYSHGSVFSLFCFAFMRVPFFLFFYFLVFWRFQINSNTLNVFQRLQIKKTVK